MKIDSIIWLLVLRFATLFPMMIEGFALISEKEQLEETFLSHNNRHATEELQVLLTGNSVPYRRFKNGS